jgi:hypothetical protein
MRGTRTPGYRVVQDDKGRATLEKIPGYRLDTSAKIRQRKSKRIQVQRPQINFSPAKR